jgi:hypothetical protein
MPLGVQRLMDDWFETRFGVRFRQCSLFATGDISVARDHAKGGGEVRHLCPVSSYSFCWSPLCDDLFHMYEQTAATEPVEELLERLNFRCEGMADAIASGNEIMLVCSSVEAHRLVAST